MERKTYPGTFDSQVLGEQLYAAFPDLQAIYTSSNYMQTPILFEFGSSSITVLMPNGTNWAAVDTVIAAYSPTQTSQASQFRTKVVALAQSAAGVALKDLTATQIKALVAYRLYRMGGIDPTTLTVKPLSDW